MANELLHLPFQNSAIDTGPLGVSVQVNGGRYEPGRIGRSIRFSGAGKAEVLMPIMPFHASWTLKGWVRAERVGDKPTASWVLFAFAEDRWISLELSDPLTSWQYIVIIQSDTHVFALVNGQETDRKLMPPTWGKPTGMALVNDNNVIVPGYVSFEDIALYDGVQNDVFSLPPLPKRKLTYRINGIDFKQFGVYVSASTGIIDNLTRKDPMATDWADYHGQVMDLAAPRYQMREITLSCWIKGVGKEEFLSRVQGFLAQFDRPGTQRLALSIEGTNPLVYEVYLHESISLKKRWNDANMYGTFELTLREPSPVKKVLLWTGAGTVSITLTTAKVVEVFWGDGTSSPNISGTNRTITHTYTGTGDYYIILAGVIEDITGFSSTASLVWNKL